MLIFLTFDRDRLEEFDEKRHSIVHDQIEIDPLPNGDKGIWFFMNNSNYLMTLLNMRFGLKLNPMSLMKAYSVKVLAASPPNIPLP